MAGGIRERLILREELAVIRTTLANERTMLAYIRTALTLFAAGVTFIKFFDHALFTVIGWALIPLSFYTIMKGVYSYNRMGVQIAREGDEARKDAAAAR